MTVVVSDPQRTLEEASPTDRERVARVAAVAELRSVSLLQMRCERAETAPSMSGPVDFDTTATGKHVLTADELVAFVRFKFSTSPDQFGVEAVYAVTYELRQTASEQDAETFVRLNALFNAWPYWRELVQSSAHRMGLAAPMIPLLKV